MSGWPLSVEPDFDAPDVDHVIELGLESSLASKESAPLPVGEVPREVTQPEDVSVLDRKPVDFDSGEQKQKKDDWVEQITTM